jgi:hypothetical protein
LQDTDQIPEEALREDLEDRVKEALQKHSVQDVLEYLRNELWQMEASTLYATKNGFGGAPDYDQLQNAIRITKQVIAKLENGEIKPPKRLQQVSLDGYFQTA